MAKKRRLGSSRGLDALLGNLTVGNLRVTARPVDQTLEEQVEQVEQAQSSEDKSVATASTEPTQKAIDPINLADISQNDESEQAFWLDLSDFEKREIEQFWQSGLSS